VQILMCRRWRIQYGCESRVGLEAFGSGCAALVVGGVRGRFVSCEGIVHNLSRKLGGVALAFAGVGGNR
jgi:hypothetical protein